MMTAAIAYEPSFKQGIKPDPVLTVSEWADRFRMLPQASSAEPGRWRTERTPYLREIMDSLSAWDPTERVVFMKGAQVGGTEAGNNWLGYIIHQAPGPLLMVQPTVDTAKRLSRQRIAPTIEATPALRELVSEARERDSGNTILSKEFPGGVMIITGANSAVGLRSMPVRYLFLDEVDAYPSDVEGEGDPVSLAIKRTSTFSRRKIFLVSTPTIKGESRIENAYEASDQRRYYVPCPSCRATQPLRWSGIVWPEGRPNDVAYKCEKCGELIAEHHKTTMFREGQWIATAPGEGRAAGFHLSALYAPLGWVSWREIVAEFLEAKRTRNRNLLKTWANTRLGETWEEKGETLDETTLFGRREAYGPKVPAGAAFLTAGVDVQDDRIEVEVVAWGKGSESWSLEDRTFRGSPAAPDVWKDLDLFLAKTYEHELGASLSIAGACIDTGGHHTQAVYAFVAPRQGRRIFAVKGSNVPGRPITSRPSLVFNGRVKLFLIGTDTAKDQLFGWLKLETPGPGFLHFPFGYDKEYFEQLTAEKIVTSYRKGFETRSYVKTKDRNEALDKRVYAMAALAILNPPLDRLVDNVAAEKKEPAPQKARPRGFVKGWR